MAWPLWVWIAGGVGAGVLVADVAWAAPNSNSGGGGGGGGSGVNYPMSTSQGGVANRTPEDWQALWTWATKLGTTPDVIGITLFEESGMDPGAKNSIGCVGLNQFCPGTYEYWVNIPANEYLILSMAQQLDYIGAFWQSKPAWSTARDLFWLNFVPATYVANADPSTILNDPNKIGASLAASIASANPGIAQGQQYITAGMIDDYLASFEQSPGWQLALQKIAQYDPSNSSS
jgi:hypothetical protein